MTTILKTSPLNLIRTLSPFEKPIFPFGAQANEERDSIPLPNDSDLGNSTEGRNDLPASTALKPISGCWKHPAKIELNKFRYKSLSSFSFNTCIGCMHGCPFCYVPSTSVNKQQKKLAELGVEDPDAQWGLYAFVRTWDKDVFLESLRKANGTPPSELKPDGNRAVMLSSTCDPYQYINNPDTERSKELNEMHRTMVRRALELIFEKSSLNVRILTRNPRAQKDFDLMKRFGDRLVFGMSLPTLNDDLARVYEPHAPSPSRRLETLKAAKAAGLNVFVALAPTFPECDDADIRTTLSAIKELNAVTIFHEPINIRAENVARINEQAKSKGIAVKTDVFSSRKAWRAYAIDSLMQVQRIATELGMDGHLHLWPDESLSSEECFFKMQMHLLEMQNPGTVLTQHEKNRFKEECSKRFAEFDGWMSQWHNRISEWPGSKLLSEWEMPDPLAADILDPVLSPVLTQDEATELADCENVIRLGWDTFMMVGKALAAINNKRLYREKYPTFEAYVRDVLNMSRSYAYRLMEAAHVIENVLPIGDKHIGTLKEAHIRELVRLEPDDQKAVVAAAIERANGAQLTSKLIREAAKPFKNPPQPKQPDKDMPTVLPVVEVEVKELEPVDNPESSQEKALAASDAILAFLRANRLTADEQADWTQIVKNILGAVEMAGEV